MQVTVSFDPSTLASWQEAEALLQRLKPAEPIPGEDSWIVEEPGDGFAEATRHFLKTRAPQSLFGVCLSWLSRQDEMGRTLRIGLSKTSDDGWGNYIQVRVPGPMGACAVLTPSTGRIDFRLPPSSAQGYEHAVARPDATSVYKVQCYLTKASYDECIALADDAAARGVQQADW